jgi:hypothetical protein
MKLYIAIAVFIISCSVLQGQVTSENLTGQVSFVSSKNVYVKFKSTAGISAGDTLFVKSAGGLKSLLTVNSLSSTSCVCTAISESIPAVADFIIAKIKISGTVTEKAVTDKTEKETTSQKAAGRSDTGKNKGKSVKQMVTGSVSVASYSDFSDTPGTNSNRFRYTLSLDAKNIANSKFSFESYLSFRHKLGEWDEVKSDLFNALKIFNLALIYDPNKTTRISVGRRINPKISNIGAVDGLQVEKSFGGFSIGALAGTRPDYMTYGFNTALLQYGGYLALNTKKSNTYSESSVAFMQQMNGSNIDRRFIYFQHSNSLLKNLYFIGTFEVDLYQLKVDSLNNKTVSNNFDPTGMYVSLRYKLSNKLSFSGSYDARKNVVYYETYKTFLDRLLETELRQGFRLQANYRITRNLSFGLQGGYRFLKADPHPSKNLYSYLTYNSIPGVNLSLTLSGTYMESSYLNGRIYGATLSRDLMKGKFQTSLGYRYIDYRLPENAPVDIQHMGEVNLYWQFAKKMSLAINYEGTIVQKSTYNRIYLQVRKRF